MDLEEKIEEEEEHDYFHTIITQKDYTIFLCVCSSLLIFSSPFISGETNTGNLMSSTLHPRAIKKVCSSKKFLNENTWK